MSIQGDKDKDIAQNVSLGEISNPKPARKPLKTMPFLEYRATEFLLLYLRLRNLVEPSAAAPVFLLPKVFISLKHAIHPPANLFGLQRACRAGAN